MMHMRSFEYQCKAALTNQPVRILEVLSLFLQAVPHSVEQTSDSGTSISHWKDAGRFKISVPVVAGPWVFLESIIWTLAYPLSTRPPKFIIVIVKGRISTSEPWQQKPHRGLHLQNQSPIMATQTHYMVLRLSQSYSAVLWQQSSPLPASSPSGWPLNTVLRTVSAVQVSPTCDTCADPWNHLVLLFGAWVSN